MEQQHPGTQQEQDRSDEREPPAAAAGQGGGGGDGPRRKPGLQLIRAARDELVAKSMARASEAQGDLNEAPRKVLDNVKATIETGKVHEAASRENASASMHQAEAARRLNQVLAEGYNEVGADLLSFVRALKRTAPEKSKFELVIGSVERMATKVAETAIEELGPAALDLLQAVFPALGAARKDAAKREPGPKSDAKKDPEPTPEGTDAAPSDEPGEDAPEQEKLMHLLYLELPEKARRVLSFAEFRDSMNRK